MVVAKQRSLRPGIHMPGKRSWVASSTSCQSRWLSVVWASRATGWSKPGEGGHVVDALDAVDRIGGHGHRADRLLVALVAHVDDLVALARTDLDLVVDLGDERADGVDHVAAPGAGLCHHLGGGSVRGQHEWAAGGHVAHVVDEHHAQVLEALDHPLVVHDLVVAVDGRLEGPHHPRQRLDGHLDAGAEPTGAASSTLSTRCGAGSAFTPSGYRRRLRGPGSQPVPWTAMSAPRVVAVAPGSPADRAGVVVGDHIVAISGQVPRDVIQYRLLVDEPDVSLDLDRGGIQLTVEVGKVAGQPLGVEVHSALFDQVRTCDNHCEFCFIYQLPPGLRESLYLKDDDYRLSFLYGNFTTLTRFTEADLERVVTERLSPLNVSIHATDPDVRADLLHNRRGATSLRWLRALLDHGIEVHGQVVVCPGVNDGAVLDDTLAGVLDRYPELASLCVVPLGRQPLVERAPACAPTPRPRLRRWSTPCTTGRTSTCATLGHRLVFAADEYYLLADRPFPEPEAYEGFAMHEDGIGMARTFELELTGATAGATGVRPGFFAWVDGAPAEGYRAPRTGSVDPTAVTAPRVPDTIHLRPSATRRWASSRVRSGPGCSGRSSTRLGRRDVRVIAVPNDFFGGNIGVTGLMVGADLAEVLRAEPEGHRYLLPDVCLSQGRFLDGTTPGDLPRPVEIVATDGHALRAALEPSAP